MLLIMLGKCVPNDKLYVGFFMHNKGLIKFDFLQVVCIPITCKPLRNYLYHCRTFTTGNKTFPFHS